MDQESKKSLIQKFLDDGGLKSRKLWLCVLGLVLLTAIVLAGCHWAAIAGMYPEFVGGVLGVLGIYTGTNVAGRVGTAKHLASKLGENNEEAAASKGG